jgi:ring-1,2-phenylacetyl-CoA epoxidase subunit PaaE
MAVAFHPLTVCDVRRETPDSVSIAFAVPPALADDYRYVPGQHLTLRTRLNGEEVRRSYSICSGLDDSELRIAVKKVEGGLFSPFAAEGIRVGDKLDVMTPQGRFGVAPDTTAARTYLAIAAGSGITPVMSIARTVLRRESQSRFVLIYGNRDSQNIIFKQTLEDLKDRYLSRFVVHHVLSREPQEVPLLHGRIDGEKVAQILRTLGPLDAVDHVFLCGPGGLIEEARGAVVRLGIPAERLHIEYFSVDGLPVEVRPKPRVVKAGEAPVATASITLHGAHHEVPVQAGETITDAGLRAGLEMPYSCRGGMCCTCRAKLTDGHVEMDLNYSLEKWETEAGYVLTCQSHPTTRKLALDFDAV